MYKFKNMKRTMFTMLLIALLSVTFCNNESDDSAAASTHNHEGCTSTQDITTPTVDDQWHLIGECGYEEWHIWVKNITGTIDFNGTLTLSLANTTEPDDINTGSNDEKGIVVTIVSTDKTKMTVKYPDKTVYDNTDSNWSSSKTDFCFDGHSHDGESETHLPFWWNTDCSGTADLTPQTNQKLHAVQETKSAQIGRSEGTHFYYKISSGATLGGLALRLGPPRYEHAE